MEHAKLEPPSADSIVCRDILSSKVYHGASLEEIQQNTTSAKGVVVESNDMLTFMHREVIYRWEDVASDRP
jgi:hypothetical protein